MGYYKTTRDLIHKLCEERGLDLTYRRDYDSIFEAFDDVGKSLIRVVKDGVIYYDPQPRMMRGGRPVLDVFTKDEDGYPHEPCSLNLCDQFDGIYAMIPRHVASFDGVVCIGEEMVKTWDDWWGYELIYMYKGEKYKKWK